MFIRYITFDLSYFVAQVLTSVYNYFDFYQVDFLKCLGLAAYWSVLMFVAMFAVMHHLAILGALYCLRISILV